MKYRKYYLLTIILVFVLLSSMLVYAQKPDLYIEDVKYGLPAPGSLQIGIGNNGDSFPEKNVEVEITIDYLDKAKGIPGEKKIHNCPYNLLKPRHTHRFSVDLKRSDSPFRVTVKIDPGNKIDELDEMNNHFSRDIKITLGPGTSTYGKPNLAVGKFYAIPYSGERVYFRIHILNKGGALPGSDFSIAMRWVPGDSSQANRWRRRAKDHPPGSEVILSSGYIDVRGKERITFTVVIDEENVIEEMTKADNSKTLIYP